MKHLVVILGPTASGKTALSLKIATHFRTEIINADSRQFYKGMDIGTAKPTKKELSVVKHHFIDSLSPDQDYNIYEFEKDAIVCIENLFRQHEEVVMVGGSGLYINAVCNGLDEMPGTDSSLREELNLLLKSDGVLALQIKLEKLDPEYYAVVDKQNPHRLIRAIEVCLLSGRKFSELRNNKKEERNFNVLKIGILVNRDELYERIDRRTDSMIQDGLLEEAQKLFPLRKFNALQTVGYQELFEHLEGKSTLPDAIEKIKQNSRNYAKRQMTWFRRDKTINWFEGGNEMDLIEFLEEKIKVKD